MKVLNELSIKDLKLNKKRSIVIIIGIILSTALICGVAGLVTSFQKTFVETSKRNSGNYHTMKTIIYLKNLDLATYQMQKL